MLVKIPKTDSWVDPEKVEAIFKKTKTRRGYRTTYKVTIVVTPNIKIETFEDPETVAEYLNSYR